MMDHCISGIGAAGLLLSLPLHMICCKTTQLVVSHCRVQAAATIFLLRPAPCLCRSAASEPNSSDEKMRFVRELWRRRLSGVQRNVEVGTV
jgi:hypothetical protein